MEFRAELSQVRQSIAGSALEIAQELEAGRAQTRFADQLEMLRMPEPELPIRAAVLAGSPEVARALLADILGTDYNVCKVVIPSRLGYSEVLLQERGFILDAGNGAREFEDAGAFVDALTSAHALESKGADDLEPLRVKLKGPAHLAGLCLLIPQDIEALVRKPALLSLLADQADWVFLAATPTTKLSSAHRETIQLVLDHVVGLQNVLVPPPGTEPEPAPVEEWWKNWRSMLSLGLVRRGSDLLRTRLSLLTAPQSELRQFLVERRLHRQLETTLTLLEQELQQAQRQLGNRLHLAREGLIGGTDAVDGRKVSENIRSRLADDCDRLLKSCEREFKAALAAEGPLALRLREAVQQITVDDIVQQPGEAVIKLTVSSEAAARLVQLMSEVARERLGNDYGPLLEGWDCSLREAETILERGIGARHRLNAELPDEKSLWDSLAALARPEIRYRSEMPRPTLATRFNAARQSIMSMMIAGTVLGGAAALAGGEDAGSLRTALYGLMLPLLVVGFLWTYVSFRKKERLALEKEIEKLHDGLYAEMRRVVQDLQREQQSMIASHLQKAQRATQQQIEAVLERVEKLRQRETDDQRRRQSEQQRTAEKRIARLRQLGMQLSGLQPKLAEAGRLRSRWLNDWINRFNQAKAA